MKYVFITGGVVSSLGKGIAASALGVLFKSRGLKIKIKKLDPYLNVDPGTMNPDQHGEVFVTEDGSETDLDLGHYERFTGIKTSFTNNITTGGIYLELLTKERRGEYLGQTVQVIPHVTDLIKQFITSNNEEADIVICEIGGTVGDIEGLPYFEAIRQLGNELKNSHVYLHMTLVPYIKSAKELKTKPTQHSVKELRAIGIQPHFILCRSEQPISRNDKDKIALFCNIDKENVFEGLDVESIYEVPIEYDKLNIDLKILNFLGIEANHSDLTKWNNIVSKIKNLHYPLNIAIVGKYDNSKDAYKSISESFLHASININAKLNIKWISSEKINADNVDSTLSGFDGIMVPGGFGTRGVDGKIQAIKYARENNIPFFGICYGMQLAAIEFARNVIGIKDANSTEISEKCTPIVSMMEEYKNNNILLKSNRDIGGTLRLGLFEAKLKSDSLIAKIYGKDSIKERHRHRFELDIKYQQQFEQNGMIFSGLSYDEHLPETIEIKSHRWFIGVQFHPEFNSTLFNPHPLFVDFLRCCMNYTKS